MRSPEKIIVPIISIFLILISFFCIYNFVINDNFVIKEYIENGVLSNSQFQYRNIINFFDEKTRNMETLLYIDGIEKSLTGKLVIKDFVAKEDVAQSADIISREIENYLANNLDLTLKELQDNLEFQKIVVQEIASNGYSLLYDANDGKVLFHPDPKLVEKDNEYLEEVSGEFYNQTKEITESGMNSSQGLYKFLGNDGVWRDKFATHKKISIETQDGHEFVLAVTAYMEDYRVLDSLNNKLEEYIDAFVDLGEVHNIFMINEAGKIIYDHNMEGDLGKNVFNLDNELMEIFEDISMNESIKIFGPSFEEHEKDLIVFSIAKRIYEYNKFLGVIIIQVPANELYEIMALEDSLGEYGESYLVNAQGKLASPIKFANGDLLIQEILTDDIHNCINEEADNLNYKTEISTNYMGDKIIGRYESVGDLCLLTEVLYNDVIDRSQKNNSTKKIIFISIILIFNLTLLIFIKKYINKKYIIKKRLHFKWFKLNNRFLNLITTRSTILFGGILVAGCIFIIWSFYGYSYPKMYEENVMDLIIIFLSFIILAQSMRIKKIMVKNLLFLGSLIVILEKSIEVVIQVIEVTGYAYFGEIVWVPIYLFRYIGIILISFGLFRRFSR